MKKPENLIQMTLNLFMQQGKHALNAYAPYSKFKVGAAVRLESGLIVRGANIENAAFPSGICAERSALSNSISNHPEDKPVALAIAAMTKDGLTIRISHSMRKLPTGYCRGRVKNRK